MGHDEIIVVLRNEVVIFLNSYNVDVVFAFNQEEYAQQIINTLSQFLVRHKREPRIHLVTNSEHGIDTISMKIKKPVLDLAVHYNDNLLPFQNELLKKLKDNSSGLFLRGLQRQAAVVALLTYKAGALPSISLS